MGGMEEADVTAVEEAAPPGGAVAARVVVDHGPPEVGGTPPARWRACGRAEQARRWRDLFTWMEWMLEAFDVDMSRAEEGMWWRTPGAVEELSALREWHRELVDVAIPAPLPPEDLDGVAEIAFQRKERALRSSVAADLVSWHNARVNVCQRLFSPATRPLLVRRAEVSEASREWGEKLWSLRREEFDRFLETVAAAEPA